MNELIQLGRLSSELNEFEKGKKKKDGWVDKQVASLRAASEGSDRTRRKKKAKDNKAGYATSAAAGATIGGLMGKYKTSYSPSYGLGGFNPFNKRSETKVDKLKRQKSNRRKFGRRALAGAGIGALVSEVSRRANNSNKKTPTGIPHPDLYDKQKRGQVTGGAKGAAIGAALGGVAGKAMSIYKARKGRLSKSRIAKPDKRAMWGAIGVGAGGLAVGQTAGDYNARKKYLKKKGVRLSNYGLKVDLDPKARRKYLK